MPASSKDKKASQADNAFKPIEWPDKISVYHKLGTVSKDSFTLDVMGNPLVWLRILERN